MVSPLSHDPVCNKGTAFTLQERRQLGLERLLPHAVETLDRQLERVLEHLDAKPNDLERYIYLVGLGDIGANGMGIPIGKLQLYTATNL